MKDIKRILQVGGPLSEWRRAVERSNRSVAREIAEVMDFSLFKQVIKEYQDLTTERFANCTPDTYIKNFPSGLPITMIADLRIPRNDILVSATAPFLGKYPEPQYIWGPRSRTDESDNISYQTPEVLALILRTILYQSGITDYRVRTSWKDVWAGYSIVLTGTSWRGIISGTLDHTKFSYPTFDYLQIRAHLEDAFKKNSLTLPTPCLKG